MSQWGHIIEPIFNIDHNINLNDTDNLVAVKKIDCNLSPENCIHYMLKHSKILFEEIDKFSTVPKNFYNKQIELVFNTDNLLKSTILNDAYINTLQEYIYTQTQINLQSKYIINHILYIIKPYILSNNFDNIDFDNLMNNIKNTLQFKVEYMTDINSQLYFLLSDETINYIKSKISEKIEESKLPTNEFIMTQLRHEINTLNGRRADRDNKITTDNYKNIYTNKLGKFSEKNIFTIIYNTIAHIISIINIESNMIKNNSKLDKWDRILGDHNKHGIRQYSQIKINNRKPQGMMFNMNY